MRRAGNELCAVRLLRCARAESFKGPFPKSIARFVAIQPRSPLSEPNSRTAGRRKPWSENASHRKRDGDDGRPTKSTFNPRGGSINDVVYWPGPNRCVKDVESGTPFKSIT